MLVLTRKKKQALYIQPGIVIRVLESRPGSVRLGIEAPPHLRVFREEVLAKTANLEKPDLVKSISSQKNLDLILNR